jgi:hypothetical protein
VKAKRLREMRAICMLGDVELNRAFLICQNEVEERFLLGKWSRVCQSSYSYLTEDKVSPSFRSTVPQ